MTEFGLILNASQHNKAIGHDSRRLKESAGETPTTNNKAGDKILQAATIHYQQYQQQS